MTRHGLLMAIAELRAAVLDVESDGETGRRVNRMCDSLAAWCRLPSNARDEYASLLLSALFNVIEVLEDDPEVQATERNIVELSLWDVCVEIGLNHCDRSRGEFIERRRQRLFSNMSSSAPAGVDRLVFAWAALLATRTEVIRQLPGPYRSDVATVVSELSSLGLPRRAKALATKFQMPVDQLLRWTIEHRPQSDEDARTRGLLQRLASYSRPLPYRVAVLCRELHQIVSAPIPVMPLTVGGGGCITIRGHLYGAGRR
jgi:hypothetical protein